METLLKIINTIFSWPTVVLIVILIFSKQLKKILEILLKRQATLKLPGNIELSLKDLQEHYPHNQKKDVEDKIKNALKKVVSNTSEKSPETLKKEITTLFEEQRQAHLKLFLKTVSYELVAWLHLNKDGQPFGIKDLLNIEHIPCISEGNIIIRYCIHSLYEKDAVASEFRRNYWVLKKLSIIEDVDEHNVRIVQNEATKNILEQSMKEVCRTENEIKNVEKFTKKFYNIPEEDK